MKILNKNGRWWKNIENEWAYKDKSGDWWIFRTERQRRKKINKRVKKGETSEALDNKFYLILVLCSLLGMSLALNVIAIVS